MTWGEPFGGRLGIAARSPDIRGALATARIHHVVAVHPTIADATGDGRGR